MYLSILLLFVFANSIDALNIPFRRPLRFKMNSLPTIVLVPGAFHVASSMDLLSSQLEQAGYDTKIIGLVTVNQPKFTVQDDVAVLAGEVLLPLIEKQGKDVVLYLHSYAGFPGSAAIKGLSKTERLAAGKRGGILGLIYQSAFIPKSGDTLKQMIGGNYAPWQDPNVLTIRRASVVTSPYQSNEANTVHRHKQVL